MQEYDYGIIGAGPAGYTAALALADKKVVLFEKDNVGGVCLNRGCIPTKTLLHFAELYEAAKNSQDLGICVDKCGFNFSKVVERKNEVIEKLRSNLERTLKSVTIIKSEAKIVDKNTVTANDEIYKCGQIIDATGSSPRQIKGMEYDHKFILSSDDILGMSELPKSIVIIGSGAIGIEFTRIMKAFEVEVTLVEIADNLLPLADIDVSKRVERLFKDVKFYTKTSVEKIDNKTVYLSNGEVLKPDCVLLAVGRVANAKEKIDGVIYIGDVTSSIQLAHVASKQALKVTSNIPFNEDLIPSIVYGTPEIAWVGKREQDLTGEVYRKSLIPISAVAKSMCDCSNDGMIKILEQNNKIVGAHIISKEASSLIQQIVISMQANMGIEELKSVCFAHPTYSEGIFDCLMRLK